MEKVKFFVKKNTKNDKIIHSICKSTNGYKFVFPPSLRDPKLHMEGIREKVRAAVFKTKAHITYVLKGKEIPFYVNVKNGDFWYDGSELLKIPAADVSNQPSEDVPFSEEEIEELDGNYEFYNEMDCDHNGYQRIDKSSLSTHRKKPSDEKHSHVNRNKYEKESPKVQHSFHTIYPTQNSFAKPSGYEKSIVPNHVGRKHISPMFDVSAGSDRMKSHHEVEFAKPNATPSWNGHHNTTERHNKPAIIRQTAIKSKNVFVLSFEIFVLFVERILTCLFFSTFPKGEHLSGRIANCDDLEAVANVIKEELEIFNVPSFLPSHWLSRFESLVQEVLPGADLDTHMFNLIPFFLPEHLNWFFDLLKSYKQSWPEFREKFVADFFKLY